MMIVSIGRWRGTAVNAARCDEANALVSWLNKLGPIEASSRYRVKRVLLPSDDEILVLPRRQYFPDNVITKKERKGVAGQLTPLRLAVHQDDFKTIA